jgi:hypothetical protein
MIGGEYLKKTFKRIAEELDELNTDDAADIMQSFLHKKKRSDL